MNKCTYITKLGPDIARWPSNFENAINVIIYVFTLCFLKQYYYFFVLNVQIIERFSRPTGTRTCTCRLQVITTRTGSHNFSCLAVETCTCTCKCFKCNSWCYPTYLIIFNRVENWELHVLNFLNIIVLYMYIFIYHRWIK